MSAILSFAGALALAATVAPAPGSRAAAAQEEQEKDRKDEKEKRRPQASGDRSDTWVQLKTKLALLTDDDAPGLGVDVDVQDGQVTLSGKVESEAEKAGAEAVAKRVEGVRGVRNLLQVVPESRREQVEAADSEIAEEVRRRLDRAGDEVGEVRVDNVNRGVVLLHGEASLPEVVRAVELARAVPGVKRVASQVQASDDMEPRAGRRTAEGARDEDDDAPGRTEAAGEREPEPDRDREDADDDSPDTWITMKTKLALLTADDVPGMRIDVDTKDGIVTLKGAVENAAAKTRAEGIARKVDGVKQVRNLLEVVPEGRQKAVEAADDRLEERVERALDEQRGIDGIKIGSVTNGVVVLEGRAPLAATLRAVQAVSAVPGVRRVSSQVEIEDER